MQTVTTNDPHVPAVAISERINERISKDQPVLWLLSGGSAIEIAIGVSRLVQPSSLLTICLADERYGQAGHVESNLRQLQEAGFPFPIVPILTGAAIERDSANYARLLYGHMGEYIIGIFGMGADGHTAGILPNSYATTPSDDLLNFYPSLPFERITVTPHFLSKLTSAHLWVQGAEKLAQIAQLQTEADAVQQPVQFLKQAGELLIYTALNP